MSEYTRTVLSELQVATMGRVGCGAVSHVRSSDGGVRSDRAVIVVLEGIVLFFFPLGVFNVLCCVVVKVQNSRWIKISDAAG